MFSDLERAAQDHQRFRLRVEGGRDVLPVEGEDGHQQLERVQHVDVFSPGKADRETKHSEQDKKYLSSFKQTLPG